MAARKQSCGMVPEKKGRGTRYAPQCHIAMMYSDIPETCFNNQLDRLQSHQADRSPWLSLSPVVFISAYSCTLASWLMSCFFTVASLQPLRLFPLYCLHQSESLFLNDDFKLKWKGVWFTNYFMELLWANFGTHGRITQYEDKIFLYPWFING